MSKQNKNLHVRVSENMYNLLTNMSKDYGCTLSHIVKVACRRLLTKGGYYRNER